LTFVAPQYCRCLIVAIKFPNEVFLSFKNILSTRHTVVSEMIFQRAFLIMASIVLYNRLHEQSAKRQDRTVLLDLLPVEDTATPTNFRNRIIHVETLIKLKGVRSSLNSPLPGDL
jgi:hypothetical protein